jgi:hypothetical protein
VKQSLRELSLLPKPKKALVKPAHLPSNVSLAWAHVLLTRIARALSLSADLIVLKLLLEYSLLLKPSQVKELRAPLRLTAYLELEAALQISTALVLGRNVMLLARLRIENSLSQPPSLVKEPLAQPNLQKIANLAKANALSILIVREHGLPVPQRVKQQLRELSLPRK